MARAAQRGAERVLGGCGAARTYQRLAAENGLAVCSLNVDLDNPNAKALYERQGYKTTRTMNTPSMRARYHSSGYEHMVKRLHASENGSS